MPGDGLGETQQFSLQQLARRAYVVPLTTINSTRKITPSPTQTVQKSICHLDIGLRSLLATAKSKGCVWCRGKACGSLWGSAKEGAKNGPYPGTSARAGAELAAPWQLLISPAPLEQLLSKHSTKQPHVCAWELSLMQCWSEILHFTTTFSPQLLLHLLRVTGYLDKLHKCSFMQHLPNPSL